MNKPSVLEAERAFGFLPMNARSSKPRDRGITEIRGPYYTPVGQNYLDDVLNTMGDWIDSFKFAGGSFTLLPRRELSALIENCHAHHVLVSTGGFVEYVLSRGAAAVERYISECRDLGFDIIEVSCGFITLPPDDWLRLIEHVQRAGMKAKPEVGIQFGAGGASRAEVLQQAGVRDPAVAVVRIGTRSNGRRIGRYADWHSRPAGRGGGRTRHWGIQDCNSIPEHRRWRAFVLWSHSVHGRIRLAAPLSTDDSGIADGSHDLGEF